MGQKVTFDPYTKTILVTVAPVFDGSNWVVELDVKIDIYSDGKEDWKTDAVLNKLLFPVKAIGGNELPGSKSLGSTFFLDYGWKIKPYEANHVLKVNGNMYARDGSSPYSTTDGSYNVQIIQSVSSLVDSTVQQLSEIERMSFNEGVTIDITSSNVGTAYPIGSVSKPSNNFDDAFDIAVTRGFSVFYVIGNLHITEAVPYVDGYTFIGSGKDRSLITIEPLANVHNCTYYDAHVTGTLDGDSKLKECVVDNLNYIKGYIELCVISSGTITLGGNETAHFLDCWSGVPGASRPTIDLGGTGQNLALRNYNGGISLINKSGTNDKVSIDLNSGTVVLYDSVTAGEIVIRGIGELLDEYGNAIQTGSWNGCTIFADGLMSKDTISGAVLNTDLTSYTDSNTVAASLRLDSYHERVTVDVINGVPGTSWPIGSENTPVNNVEDAAIIASSLGFIDIKIQGDYTFGNTVNIANFNFIGEGKQKSTFTFIDGAIVAYCTFEKAKLTGNVLGIVGFSDCHVVDYGSSGLVPSSSTINVNNCIIQGELSVPSNFTGTFIVTDSYMIAKDGVLPNLNMGNANFEVQVRNLSGYFSISNCTEASNVRVYFNSGGVELKSSITSGNFVFTGVGVLVDNSTSVLSLDTSALISKDLVSAAVLDNSLTTHDSEGTVGASLAAAAYNGILYIDANSGNTGTVYPVGTWGHPVNNIADAVVISSKHEINTWHFHSGMTITNGIDISNRTIEAHVGLDSYITLETGVVCDNTIFRNIKLKGDIDGICTYNHCEIDGVTNMQGSFDHCIFEGANSLKSGYSNIMQIRDCMSYSSSVWTSLDIGDNQVNVVGWLGLLQIGGKDGVNELTLHGSLAYFYLLPTCTAGDVIVSGRGRLLDTSDAGCTVTSDYMYNTDIQADKVWEELSAEHTDSLTMGGKLNTASSGGVDYNALGDAVWDHSTATDVVSVLNNVETMSTRILGLSQENFKFFGHAYDSDGNLTSANIRVYPTSTDVENNTNPTASYRVLASYTDKKLTDYQVLKI